MTTQIAVKMPDALLGEVDRLVADGIYESRSQAIRSGLEAIVSTRRRKSLDQLYRDGFARLPDTEDELDDARRLAAESIREEPWERWW